MLERRWGRVVNIASVAGLRGGKYIAAYSAAKHAVVGFTRSLAAEVAGSGVTVNAVCPGYVDTDMTRESVARIATKTGMSPPDALRAALAAAGQRRLISPEEVARAVLGLCDDAQRDTNGEGVVIAEGGGDGGAAGTPADDISDREPRCTGTSQRLESRPAGAGRRAGAVRGRADCPRPRGTGRAVGGRARARAGGRARRRRGARARWSHDGLRHRPAVVPREPQTAGRGPPPLHGAALPRHDARGSASARGHARHRGDRRHGRASLTDTRRFLHAARARVLPLPARPAHRRRHHHAQSSGSTQRPDL